MDERGPIRQPHGLIILKVTDAIEDADWRRRCAVADS